MSASRLCRLLFSSLLLLFSTLSLAQTASQTPNELATLFSRSSQFSQVKISPNGDYISAITHKEGKTALLLLNATTLELLHLVRFSSNAQVGDYIWANDQRLVMEKEYIVGWQSHPIYYGELYAINADGSKPKYIFGYKRKSMLLSSHAKQNQAIRATGYILDPLINDDKHLLVSAIPWDNKNSRTLNTELAKTVYKVNIDKGTRTKVTRAPIENSQFMTDHQGQLRFVSGSQDHLSSSLFYRKNDAWVNVNKLGFKLDNMNLIAFGKEQNQLYVSGENQGQPLGIYRVNTTTGAHKKIIQNPDVDYSHAWINPLTKELYAIEFENGYPSYAFINKNDPFALYTKQLLNSFTGLQVRLVSSTKTADKVIVKTFNDTSPGQYYLFDTQAVKLRYLFSEKSWIEPKKMATVKPVQFSARDGQIIHGYLTLPKGQQAKDLPLVVNPHGGPYGVRDGWEFDVQNQLFASQGMAVLQVNFRGSGGYGQAFEALGYQKWGTDIQYDIIDGTKDLIAQGIVDKNRICIAGSSFGGYSALQSSIIEPDLFQCAIGMFGVYDLAEMFEEGDISDSKSGQAYLSTVLGDDPAQLQAMSPAQHVDKLKAKLLLIHGGKDERAPIEQFEALESALNKRKYPFDSLLLDDEGHGFYKDEHQAQAYRKMLSFLKENLKL
ncbi:alpha/beta hydrolase family protein [Shewanella surugensis]|uniref:S9 family peptidase n=1 Tax=Shewanella surugensis TaxID=212020 RepID=A0ABT0L796_9GAMM|nr:S9 family peptidase [Shewanella surugensis]MCL1123572.1 S9 family peptidase [Shewanella surugensis]